MRWWLASSALPARPRRCYTWVFRITVTVFGGPGCGRRDHCHPGDGSACHRTAVGVWCGLVVYLHVTTYTKLERIGTDVRLPRSTSRDDRGAY